MKLQRNLYDKKKPSIGSLQEQQSGNKLLIYQLNALFLPERIFVSVRSYKLKELADVNAQEPFTNSFF